MKLCYGRGRNRPAARRAEIGATLPEPSGNVGETWAKGGLLLEITLLNILYLVLIVAVVAVGGLLAAVLWQTIGLIRQARTIFVPQVQTLLEEARLNLENAEGITSDVNGKLAKLDGAFEAANTAAQSIGETTLLVNKTVAKPLVIHTAAFFTGVKSAAAYLRDHRKDRKRSRQAAPQPELEVEPLSR